MLSEAGSSATNDGKYNAGTGSGTAGDSTASARRHRRARARHVLSGTLTPTIGAKFTNATGSTVTSLDVAYTGEEWRLGATGRADRLDFQYSLDATDLATGAWTDTDCARLRDPEPPRRPARSTATRPRTAARSAATIAGLSIPGGKDVWIRWNDFNAAGSDDGLAVDDFSMTPHTTTVTNQPVTASCGAGHHDARRNCRLAAGLGDGRGRDRDLDRARLRVAVVVPRSRWATSHRQATPGGTATATLNVSSTAAAGTYSVQVRATNDDATPQRATCALRDGQLSHRSRCRSGPSRARCRTRPTAQRSRRRTPASP